jgi:hypothetical protein
LRATNTNSVSWFLDPEAIVEPGQRESLEETVKRLERELTVINERLADAPPRDSMRFPLASLIIIILLLSFDLTLIRKHLQFPAGVTGPGTYDGVVIASFNVIFAFAVGLIYGRKARLIGWSVIIGVCLLCGFASYSFSELVFDVVHNAHR